jgi:hypothetical protein
MQKNPAFRELGNWRSYMAGAESLLECTLLSFPGGLGEEEGGPPGFEKGVVYYMNKGIDLQVGKFRELLVEAVASLQLCNSDAASDYLHRYAESFESFYDLWFEQYGNALYNVDRHPMLVMRSACQDNFVEVHERHGVPGVLPVSREKLIALSGAARILADLDKILIPVMLCGEDASIAQVEADDGGQ